VEWPERSLASFPAHTIHITLSYVEHEVNQRLIEYQIP
jgi:tRNA A37 threonylcarbamoyladenosine biosynthesis protein TsaE